MDDYVLAMRIMLQQILNAVLISLARRRLPSCGDKLLNQSVYPIDIGAALPTSVPDDAHIPGRAVRLPVCV